MPWPKAAAGCRTRPQDQRVIFESLKLAACAGRQELQNAALFVGGAAGAVRAAAAPSL